MKGVRGGRHEGSEIRFLARLHEWAEKHGGDPRTEGELASADGTTSAHVRHRLEPFVRASDVKLIDNRYHFNGRVLLTAKETGEVHQLGTWIGLFRERDME